MNNISNTLINALEYDPKSRSKEDIEIIIKYLKQISELEHSDNNDFTLCAHIVQYKTYKKNNIFPRKSESVMYWCNILYGSVMVGSSMFLPSSSFWIKEDSNKEKQYECIVLEDTGVLLFPYDECSHFYYPCKCVKKLYSDSLSKMKISQKSINKSQTGSDTSSGYSGSDKISNGDSESIVFKIGNNAGDNNSNNSQLLRRKAASGSNNLDTLTLDSDSEEDDLSDFTFNEISCQDHIKDILQKTSTDRSIQENEVIMNIIQNTALFSLWTQSLRNAACKLARLQVVENAQTVLMKKDEKLTDWIYCLQGTLEVRRTNENGNQDSDKHLSDVLETIRYSDCLGADLRLSEEQTSKFFLVTTSNDCWLMLINWKEFMKIKAQEPTTLSQIIENNKTVMIMERRCGRDGVTKGQVLVKATVKKLIDYLFENHGTVDETFIDDFFLTYNMYMDSTVLVRNVIIDFIRRFPDKRKKCTEIVVKWIKNHFKELENQPEIMKFIDFLVMLLFRENEEEYAGKIYRACSFHSTQRNVTIVSNDKDQGSRPIIVGSGSRISSKDKIPITIDHYPREFISCNLFRDGQKLNNLYISQVRNCTDLRPGDKVIQINNTSEENLTQKDANSILSKSQLSILTVKFDPEGFYSPFLVNYLKKKTRCNSNRSIHTHSAVLDLHDTPPDPGYSTLPLKPKLGGIGPQNQGKMKKIMPNNVNQSATSSALKKMMKRCKANNSFTDEKKQRSKSKSRSAHNSPDRFQVSTPDLAFNDNFSDMKMNTNVMSTSFTGASSTNLKVETPTVKMRKVRSRCDSQPDLRKMSYFNSGDFSNNSCESVIKIYYKDSNDTTLGKPNVKVVYLIISKETEALEVIVKSLVELNLSCASNAEFCLCEVSVEPGSIIKQRIIKENSSNLMANVKLNNRFYLKRRDFSGKLIDNVDIEEINSEMNVSFFDIPVCELATQVFVESYNAFRLINLSEVIDFVTGKSRKELFNSKSKSDSNTRSFAVGINSENRESKMDNVNNFQEFLKLSEKYMYFVINVVCNETNSTSKRGKILKRLIRMARFCKELGNIEVFFSLMNGLDRVEISRLRNTWDRVPNKEMKMYRQMQQLLDVSGNMRLLRSLHKSCKPPVIPMAALVTKDLTTINEVHPTKVEADGPENDQKSESEYLINFDKLRIMANRARSFKNLLYDCDSNNNGITQSSHILPDDESAQIAFIRELLLKIDLKEGSKGLLGSQNHLNRRKSACINPKKIYENEISRLRVKHFISKIEQMERDDAILLAMSYKCEPRSEISGLTPNVSRSTMAGILASPTGNYEREEILNIRNSTGGSISSKESSQTTYSSGSEQFSELTNQSSYRMNQKYNRMNASTPLSGQLQYLEPSGSQRRHILPPPYSSVGSGPTIPPIPPRRRSSVVSAEKTKTFSNPLSNDIRMWYRF